MTLSQLERDLATLESFTHNTPVKEVFDRIKKELSGSDQICCLGSDQSCAHEWVLIEGNPVVTGMDICVKCHSLKAHDTHL